MSDVWVPLGSALLGAAVGGAASAVGSIVVDRRKVAYRARTAIHLDLLPDFKPSRYRYGKDGPSTDSVLATIHRTAVLARRRDRRLVAAVQAAWDALDVAKDREVERIRAERESSTGEGERAPEFLHVEAEEAALQSALAALARHLERKLR